MNSKKSTWIGGTAFVAVVLLAMAWFLLVSPVLQTANETKDQTRTTNAQNAELQRKVDKLKADFAHIDEYRAELATIATQIPPAAELAPYVRQLDEFALANEVTVLDVTPQSPYLVTLVEDFGKAAGGAVSTEATPTPEPTPSPSASASPGTETGAAAPGGTEAPAGMSAIPVSMTVVGSYEGAVAFLDAVQHTTRLFLVGGLTGTMQQEKAATGGRPDTELGDLELKVEGFLYAMPSLATPPDPDAEPTPAPALPGATDRNPLIPIQGADAPTNKD